MKFDTKGGSWDTCKACEATIVWVKTKAGKNMPCNPDGEPHWATCTDVERFRGYDAGPSEDES